MNEINTEAQPTNTVPVRRGWRTAALGAVGVGLIANAAVVGALLMHRATAPMSNVDRTCVAVLHNGGVPEDCSRMYHLSIFP